jgi:hypothetical protein
MLSFTSTRSTTSLEPNPTTTDTPKLTKPLQYTNLNINLMCSRIDRRRAMFIILRALRSLKLQNILDIELVPPSIPILNTTIAE